MMTNQALTSIAAGLNQSDVTALYASVGEGRISAQTIVARLIDVSGGVDGAADDTAEAIRPTFGTATKSRNHDVGVVVDGADDVVGQACTVLHACSWGSNFLDLSPGDPVSRYIAATV